MILQILAEPSCEVGMRQAFSPQNRCYFVTIIRTVCQQGPQTLLNYGVLMSRSSGTILQLLRVLIEENVSLAIVAWRCLEMFVSK